MQFTMVRRRLLLLVLSLVFVSWAKSMASAEEECNFAEEAIRIGVLAPLSSPGAVLSGTQVQWGAEYATERRNADCGIMLDGVNYRIEISVGDSEGLPERGQNAVQRLIFEDEIRALVGGYHSAIALATMGILHSEQIPTIFANPWNDNVTVNGILPYAGPASAR